MDHPTALVDYFYNVGLCGLYNGSHVSSEALFEVLHRTNPTHKYLSGLVQAKFIVDKPDDGAAIIETELSKGRFNPDALYTILIECYLATDCHDLAIDSLSRWVNDGVGEAYLDIYTKFNQAVDLAA
jgi:hypothetical protein